MRLRAWWLCAAVLLACFAAGCGDVATAAPSAGTTVASSSSTSSTAATASTSTTGASAASVSTTTPQAISSGGSGRPFGFDPRAPFVDHDAMANDPAYKIVTAYVAIGNRTSTPLPFSLSHLELSEMYDFGDPNDKEHYYTETVAPIWKPVLKAGDIAPSTVVGGYVSWKVPWFVWPIGVFYKYQGRSTDGAAARFITSIFPDVNYGGPYYLPVGRLLYRGMVSGYPDGTFRPYAPLTVQALLKLAVLAVAPYNRISPGLLAGAANKGLVTWGSKGGREAATRLEVALAVAHAAQGKLTAPPAGYQSPFTDVPADASADIALLAYNGVVGGTSTASFNPDGVCTRGQAAKMFAAMLVKTTVAP